MENNHFQCLFELSAESLFELVKDTLSIENWFIREDSIANRTNAICCSERFLYLEKIAKKKKIKIDNAEIVTWLDSLTILYYVFKKMEDEYLKDSIIILQEYCIPYHNKRADYLLVYDNKILILEFSFNKLGYELQYESKLRQVMEYKELLSSLLPKEIDIGTYTFMVEPEEDKWRNTINLKNTDFLPNHYKIENLAQFIEKFFKKNIDQAINALKQL